DGASMVYDPATNYTLYFAGEDLGVYLNQTWTFLGGTFTELSPSRAPPTAQYMTATFDLADGYVLAFGGAIKSHLSGQTWAWSRPLPLTLSASDSASSTTVGTTERFSATAWGGVAPLAVGWQFGDNSSAPGGDTQHTYSWPGNYTANCTASDATGTRTTQSFTILVTWGAGTPIIVTPSASPTSGPATLTVTFVGAATGGFPGYVPTWSYGDGSPPASGWNETHPYTRTGSFTATLSVTDRAGRSGSATTSITVTAPPPPPAPLTLSVSGSPTGGSAPLTVTFSSTTHGGTPGYTYAWTFGDGGASATSNATYTYLSAGSFTATLTVRDSSSHATSRSVMVNVTGSSAPPGGAPGFLGLPGDEGVLLLGGLVAVVVVVAAVAVFLLRRRPPATPQAYPEASYPGTTPSYPPASAYPRTPYPYSGGYPPQQP
ncbi:MAG: PKD domain-containing protein, partial [Thermoplasmata archaeon]|nr:PKD domain-containing protein [Thermoplasmata archaeon]